MWLCSFTWKIRCKGRISSFQTQTRVPNSEKSIKEKPRILFRKLRGYARWMNSRINGQINEFRPGIKRSEWEGFPWVGTGRQPSDGKLSNSFHQLPEDWSFTRARWAGATRAAWRSSTKPRCGGREEPSHHPAHALPPDPNPSSKSTSTRVYTV